MSVVPNKAQFVELASSPIEGPVVMLNLLKFKPSGGAGEYKTYGDQAVEFVKERGGRLMWHGKVQQTLIGDVDADGWDYAALVEYPSRAAFIDMVTNADYQQTHTHREAGTERALLLACGTVGA